MTGSAEIQPWSFIVSDNRLTGSSDHSPVTPEGLFTPEFNIYTKAETECCRGVVFDGLFWLSILQPASQICEGGGGGAEG